MYKQPVQSKLNEKVEKRAAEKAQFREEFKKQQDRTKKALEKKAEVE